jgi:probable F420-dependent oxidoreductase
MRAPYYAPVHRFRFGVQASRAATMADWRALARRCEGLGYSCLYIPDHFGDQFGPLVALTVAAEATSTLHVGSLVFDNDYRHPLVLAKEAATLDLLSDGRLELGLGAGWMRTDYEQSGIEYDPPGVRVDRFAEGVEIISGLLSSDGPFSFSGKHYTIRDHTLLPRPVQRPRPPLILGGGGRRVLTIAAQWADIVGINVNLREGTGGPEAAPNATPDATRQKIAWVKEAAGDRFDDIELNSLIGFAIITEDRQGVIDAMAPAFGIDPGDAVHVPLALIGTLDQMAEELQWRRDEYGLSYFSVEADCWEAIAPVVGRLAGT